MVDSGDLLTPSGRGSTRTRRRRAWPGALAAALVLAACSSDDAATDGDVDDVGTATQVESSEPTESPESTVTPPTTAAPSTTTARPTTAAPSTTTTEVPADPYRIDTAAGVVEGGPSAVVGVRNFLAIPFGEAPVGDLAWRPPEPRAAWSESFDATRTGAACPQTTTGITTSFVITPDPDPDCLTLSVWSPDGADGLPVMVWFHGGGLTTGSAHEPYYNGDDLAAEGVIVVNVNYRLGAFGFLALDELRGDDGALGNHGFQDQQLALEWVQDNIAAFGGDPSRVTIFGESAGGFSVCGHLASPASDGLFARAIIQSGGGCDRFQSEESALADGAELLAAVDCPDVDCLRSTPGEEIIAANEEIGVNSLVLDGVIFESTGAERAADGDLDGIPVLIGSNADESTLFTIGLEEPTDDGLVELAAGLVDDAEALVSLYPPDSFESNVARFQAMSTDVSFTCPALAFAALVPQGFAYHFTYVSESNPLGLGATHGAELAFLFAHADDGLAIETESTERSQAFSAEVQAAWAEFARTGDPGEAFDPLATSGTVTILDDTIEAVTEIREGRCDEVNALR